MIDLDALLRAHTPSLKDADEDLIWERITRIGAIDESVDVADLALRHCSCGVDIDGFYEYVDHLRREANIAPALGGEK